mgnify:FL=1
MSKAAELASLASASETALSNRNIVINGAMQISQRSVSETGLGGDQGYFTVDRMLYFENGTTDVRFTQSQSTDVPTGGGFGKSLKFDCTTADASLAVDNQLTLKHRIEGQNIQQLKWGTSSAEDVTLSFWINATKTGTYIVEFSRESRKISQAYTVSSSDTWEKKTLTFDGDTGGSVVTNDSANRLEINFYMGVGTNYSSGTLETTWTGGTNANRAVGQVNAFDNTSNNILFTGVQLEVGPVATPFAHRSYGQELALCSRYYTDIVRADNKTAHLIGYVQTSTVARFGFHIPMRTSPSITVTNFNILYAGGSEQAITSIDDISQDNQFLSFRANVAANLTSGQAVALHSDGAATLTFDAEL